ncbi:MAG: ABC transporter ATP-binding protein [Erysipelotrichaceae bacterium]
MIKFLNVTKSFKQNEVLHNLDIMIHKGEIVVLLGLSGCGKTTTLKMINKLIQPTTGKILINGNDISELDTISLRRSMGYVIQQTGLFPHMSIKENIEIVPKLMKKDSVEIDKRTVELMEMVNLDRSFLSRYPSQLSGGQLQRVGVARALALDPEIILMDEPFSALDPITRVSLQDELLNIQSKYKKTIVFVTHDMDEALKIADRICIMDKGHVVQFDTTEQILKHPANDFVSTFVGKGRIWSSPELIKVEDIMLKNPISASINLPIMKALEKMIISKVNSLLVIDDNNCLQGLVRPKVLLEAQDKTLPISSVMRKIKYTVYPEDNMVSVLKILKEKNISAIPVISHDNKLVGLLTNASLVSTLSLQFLDEHNFSEQEDDVC